EAVEQVTGGVDPTEVVVAGWPDDRRRGRRVLVAAEVALFVRVVKQRRAVVAAEPAAPVVAHATLLREAGDRLQGADDRTALEAESEVAAANVELIALGVGDDSAEQAVGAVDPVVQAQREAVHARLEV